MRARVCVRVRYRPNSRERKESQKRIDGNKKEGFCVCVIASGPKNRSDSKTRRKIYSTLEYFLCKEMSFRFFFFSLSCSRSKSLEFSSRPHSLYGRRTEKRETIKYFFCTGACNLFMSCCCLCSLLPPSIVVYIHTERKKGRKIVRREGKTKNVAWRRRKEGGISDGLGGRLVFDHRERCLPAFSMGFFARDRASYMTPQGEREKEREREN